MLIRRKIQPLTVTSGSIKHIGQSLTHCLNKIKTSLELIEEIEFDKDTINSCGVMGFVCNEFSTT